jgi:hypothetical protein
MVVFELLRAEVDDPNTKQYLISLNQARENSYSWQRRTDAGPQALAA